MLAAVCFDNETRLIADEICDIRTDENLTPELCASELAVAQDAPKRVLCVRHVMAKVTSLAQRR